jgi:DNA-directed RNA polymerase subunit K/omega
MSTETSASEDLGDYFDDIADDYQAVGGDDDDLDPVADDAEDVETADVPDAEDVIDPEIPDDALDLSSVSSHNIEIIVVKRENHRTSDILSHFEMTELVGIRATQISQNGGCFTDTTGLTNPTDMAKRELMARQCPLVVRRYVGIRRNPATGLPAHYYEYKSPREMVFEVIYDDV